MSEQSAKTDSRSIAAQDTQLRILEAAEQVFALDGYSGASMRAIAETAKVAQGLLHYHFENKQNLYAAIVSWRAKTINHERLALLRSADGPLTVPEILRALFQPALGTEAGGAAYAQIMARMMSGDAMHQDLVRVHYDPTARIFIGAIETAGGLTPKDAAWAYNLAIHVLVSGMARAGRAERLVGDAEPAGVEEYLERLVAFAVGGVNAFAREKRDEIH